MNQAAYKTHDPGKVWPLFFLFLVCITFFFPHRAMASGPIVLGPQQEEYDPCGSLEILEDPKREWTIDDVSSSNFANKFTLLEGQPAFLGDTKSAFWIRFTVDSPSTKITSKTWVLSAFTRALESAKLYSNRNGRWSVTSGGYSEIGEITIPVVLSMTLLADKEQTFYLRVSNRGPTYFLLSIETSKVNAKKTGWRMFWFGGFYGLMGLVILLNLFLFFFLKNKSYLFCCLYQTAVSIYAFGQDGFLDTYFPDPKILSWVYFHIVLIAPIVFFSGAFTRSFLNTKSISPRLDKFLVIYMGSTLLMLAITPFANWKILMMYTMALGMLTPVVTIWPGINNLSTIRFPLE